MKFTLIEHEAENISKEEFETFLKEHCSQFLNEVKNFRLYRGMSFRDFLPNYTILKPRTDRKPLNMHPNVQRLLDDIFLKKFGWKARSSGVFASGNKHGVAGYGTVYEIYPTDGYKFLWSPKVGDLYEAVFWDEYGYVDTDDPDFVEKMNSYKDKNLIDAIMSEHEVMIQCDRYAARRI